MTTMLALPFTFASYAGATGCTAYGPFGAQSLLTYIEDCYPQQTSMGICNCRPVAGGGAYSHHAECRAYDCGVAVSIDGGEIGRQILNRVMPHGVRLGIDHVIYNLNPMGAGRGDPRIWSAAYPYGRVYTGVHPHKDHAHIGLTRASGRSLTYATLVSVCGIPTSNGGDNMTWPAQTWQGPPARGKSVPDINDADAVLEWQGSFIGGQNPASYHMTAADSEFRRASLLAISRITQEVMVLLGENDQQATALTSLAGRVAALEARPAGGSGGTVDDTARQEAARANAVAAGAASEAARAHGRLGGIVIPK